MRKTSVVPLLTLLAGVSVAKAQDTPTPLGEGIDAPTFTRAAATTDGVSPKAVSLQDFRGQTVVLAFFYKARTGG